MSAGAGPTAADLATAQAFSEWLDDNWKGGKLPPLKLADGATVSSAASPGAQFLTYWAYVQKNDPQAPLKAAEESYYFYQLAKTGLGEALGKALSAGGAALGDVSTGVSTAQYLPSWATGLGDLLGDLEQRALWLRLAKGAAGLALIIIGVLHLTGAGNVIEKAIP